MTARRIRAIDSASSEALIVAGLIALGVLLRVVGYALNPSLSVDEASLALNIVHRSYSDLFGELDFNQAAPAGFLMLQKFLVQAVGNSPYSLRLIPLLAGVAALLLIYPVAKAFVGRRPALVALALFAISGPLVAYASVNKQYSIDVAVTLALYALAVALPRLTNQLEIALVAGAGAVAVWLSHPSAFVLAAWGAVLLFDSMARRVWRDSVVVSGVIAVWLLSFAVAYVVTQSSVAHVRHSIASSNPTSFTGGGGQPGLAQTYGGMARSLLGIPDFTQSIRSLIAVAAMLLALVGLGRLLRVNVRAATLLALPGAIALVVSALHFYPLYPRTFLFVIPALVILVSAGFSLMIERRIVAAVLASATVAGLFGTAAYASAEQIHSSSDPGARAVLRELARNARRGDFLYLYLTSQYDYRYYLECGCFASPRETRRLRAMWPIIPAAGRPQFAPPLRSALPRLIAGQTTSPVAGDYRRDLGSVASRARVWVLVIDPSPKDNQGLDTFLRRRGTPHESFSRPDARPPSTLSLYDFRSANS
jgi:hypothetical protein